MQLEGHLTRNLNESWWVALDSIFIQGGETTTVGVSDHNRQRSFALGATVSVAVSDAVSATLSYTEEVSRTKMVSVVARCACSPSSRSRIALQGGGWENSNGSPSNRIRGEPSGASRG